MFYAKQPLAFEPGSKESDSPNAAFDVAAYIVQKLSGVPYDEFLKNEIFIPCGMNDTAFIPSDEQWSRMIFMHDRKEDEKVQGGNQRWALGGRVIMDESYGTLPPDAYGWSGAYGTHFRVDFTNEITAVYMKNSLYDGGAGCNTANNFEEDVYASLE